MQIINVDTIQMYTFTNKEVLTMTECYNWCMTQEIGVEIFSLTYPGNDCVDFKCSLLIQDDLFFRNLSR